MLTLAFPDPPTTLDEETDEGKGTDDDYRIEDDLNQYREGCSCYSMEPEMGRVSRIWQHVFRGPHTWVSKDTSFAGSHGTSNPPQHQTFTWPMYLACQPDYCQPSAQAFRSKRRAASPPANISSLVCPRNFRHNAGLPVLLHSQPCVHLD
ncbi:hypothetical protein L211DRAFT_461096 [Terfezia boudieri ATCC MYA-4762]|uniref:Uncharacterized protein n=1 Tax=Terfezia boudieri ATCC MYA-4762 TaxID=1051890 RepID=A0A3N4LHZ3_9PEZI|nr:hypothetical protein L211DRAFT_461096 [Terfezia boudieri ATCC MYA-4762]